MTYESLVEPFLESTIFVLSSNMSKVEKLLIESTCGCTRGLQWKWSKNSLSLKTTK